MSKHILSHYDPAVMQMHKSLELAKSTGASPDVIKSIESALELVELREKFTADITSKGSDATASIEEETYKHDWEGVHKQGKTIWQLRPRMMSGHLEGQFLKSIISIQRAKRVLDIGMFTGFSALSMAEALPVDGEVVTIDRNEYLKTLVEDLTKKSPHHKKIRILIGEALDLLKQLSSNGEHFDLIFLDADKSEYMEYFKIAIEGKLLNPGGTILVDNAYMHGKGYIPSEADSVTKKFADAIAADPSLHKVLVPIRDGVLMIRRMSDVEGAEV